LVRELADSGFDEMNLQPSRHNGRRDSHKLCRNVNTHNHPQSQSKTDSPNDIIGISPIRSNGIHHDLGLDDGSFNRRVIPQIYNDQPDFISKLELCLESFQLILRPSGDGECEWGGTRTFWMRVEVLSIVFSREAWRDRNLQSMSSLSSP